MCSRAKDSQWTRPGPRCTTVFSKALQRQGESRPRVLVFRIVDSSPTITRSCQWSTCRAGIPRLLTSHHPWPAINVLYIDMIVPNESRSAAEHNFRRCGCLRSCRVRFLENTAPDGTLFFNCRTLDMQ